MNIDELRTSARATVTIRDAAELVGVDPRTLSSALSINGGDIRALRIGRRVVIPRDALVAWLEGRDERIVVAEPATPQEDPRSAIRAKLVELLGELEGVA